MSNHFAEQKIHNVDYRLRAADDYAQLHDCPDRSFDLVLIDGIFRDRAASTALTKVKPGGYVLLDNSDVPTPEFQNARSLLMAAAQAGESQVFRDLHPFQFQVNESLLVRIAKSS